MFAELPGDVAIMIVNGKYNVYPLYEFQGRLFAKVSGGFVQLFADKRTSMNNCRVEQITYSGELWVHRATGKLYTTEAPGTKRMEFNQQSLLLVSPDAQTSATEQTENK